MRRLSRSAERHLVSGFRGKTRRFMRGDDRQQPGVFSGVSAEDGVCGMGSCFAGHSADSADEALAGLWAHFDLLYAAGGRPSIAPEELVGHCCCRRFTRSEASVC